MSKKICKILGTVNSLLVGMAVLLAVLLVGVRIFGLQVYMVLSGSMEPTYRTGSILYIKSVDSDELEVNDVITFSLSEKTTATHRIVEILQDEKDYSKRCFTTKGDANKESDSKLVLEEDVIGTPVFTIPYLGYVANFIQKPPGMYLAIAVGLILIIHVFIFDTILADSFAADDKKKSKNNKTEE